MLLEDKTVVVYGASAAHSAALVRAFAGQRSLIFFADSSRDAAEAAARRMIDAGAVAEAAEVDLFDRRQIEEYTAELVEWTGGIDVAVVAIRGEDGDAAQLTAVRTLAERMAAQGSGIIVIMSIADYERDYRELIEQAADHGVAVLPLFCAPARGQRHSIPIDRPAHS